MNIKAELRLTQLSTEHVIALGEGKAVVLDRVLPDSEVACFAEVLHRLYTGGAMVPAQMGRRRRHHDRNLRGDWTCWLESDTEEDALRELWWWWKGLQDEIRQKARLSLSRFSVQLSHYPVGTRYVRHRDAMPGQANRLVTAVLYLNPGWQSSDGGKLRVWEPGGARDIAPIAGRLVLFLSELDHAVLLTVAPRFAVTAWFWGPEAVPLLPEPQARC